MSDPDPEVCEVCGAAPLQKVLHPVPIHFKGSGFYSTDYGRKGRKRDSSDSSPDGGGEEGREEGREGRQAREEGRGERQLRGVPGASGTKWLEIGTVAAVSCAPSR